MGNEIDISVNNTNVSVNQVDTEQLDIDTPYSLPAHNISFHSDVNTAGAVANDYFKFDGTNWVKATPDWLTVSAFNTSPAGAISVQDIIDWDDAYSWGDHANEGYLIDSNNLNDIPLPATARTNLGFPTTALGQVLFGAANNLYQQASNFVYDGTQLGVGLTTPTATLHARGANVSLGDIANFQNLSGTTRFRVANDGTTNLCNASTIITHGVLGTGILDFLQLAGGSYSFRSGQTVGGSISYTHRIASAGVSAVATGTVRESLIVMSDARNAGSGRYAGVEIQGTVNNTGTGITCALLINNTVTSSPDFRAIEVAAGKIFLGGTGVHSYLVLNRLTSTQRNALVGVVAGSVIYNITTNKMQCYDGTAWQDLF